MTNATDYTTLTGAQLLNRKKRAEKAKADAEQALKRIAQENRKIDAHMKIAFAAWLISAAKKSQIAKPSEISPLFAAISMLAQHAPIPDNLTEWLIEQKAAIMAAKAPTLKKNTQTATITTQPQTHTTSQNINSRPIPQARPTIPQQKPAQTTHQTQQDA